MKIMDYLKNDLISDCIADYAGNRYQVTHVEDDFVIAIRLGDSKVCKISADKVNMMRLD